MDRFNLPAFSILGIARFTLLQRHVELAWTIALSVVVGVVLASAFPAIVVYAQDMMSHRIGMVSGLFYGLSFGLGGLRAGVLDLLAEPFGIVVVYPGVRISAAPRTVRRVRCRRAPG